MRVFSWLHNVRAHDDRNIILFMIGSYLARRTFLHKFPSFGSSGIPASEQPWVFLDRQMFMEGRVMMRTDGWFMGLVPAVAKPSDEIWLLKGPKALVVLRPCGGVRVFEILGEAYVHGVMQGEAWRPEACVSLSVQ